MLRRLLFCVLLLAFPARAVGAPQQLLEPGPVAVPRSLNQAEVERAVLDAAARREWNIVSRHPGEMLLCYQPREVSATVRIAYDNHRVLITYVGSTGLDYTESGGLRYIHRNYNRWVQHLAIDILDEMLRLKGEHERSAG